jgi:hypothetical protein
MLTVVRRSLRAFAKGRVAGACLVFGQASISQGSLGHSKGLSPCLILQNSEDLAIFEILLWLAFVMLRVWRGYMNPR